MVVIRGVAVLLVVRALVHLGEHVHAGLARAPVGATAADHGAFRRLVVVPLVRPVPARRQVVGGVVVEVLDEQFRPLPGFTTGEAIPLAQSGFRLPAAWRGKTTLDGGGKPVRVRVNFEGVRPEDIRVYATYVAKE